MTPIKRNAKDLDWTSWPIWPTWFGPTMFDFPTLGTVGTDDAGLRVEQFDLDGDVVVRAEMPGVDPERDVEITVADGCLHIRGERRTATTADATNCYRSEFRYGSFERTLSLPPGAAEDDITATYTHGVLEVRIPIDTEKVASKRIPIVAS